MAEAVTAGDGGRASTCSSRPAPAPASRWPTWSRACSTRTGSWSRRPPSRSSTSWSSATCRGWSRPSRQRQRRRHVVRRAQGPLQLRLPAPHPRGRARRPGRPGRAARGLARQEGARAARLGRGARSRARRSGERDNAPRHTDREWRQVSVNHRECLGAAKCPFGQECFAELAKEKAHRSHLIVTNHSLLAIDAIEGVPMIPEYDVVVIDEAHELTTRVTQAATDELWAAEVERAARRSQRHVEGDQANDLADAADALRDRDRRGQPGPLRPDPRAALRRAGAGARRGAGLRLGVPQGRASEDADAGLTQAKGAVQEVFATAERMAADLESDVLWMSEGTERMPPRLCVAPLQVWGPMRDKLLTDKTVVFTSATLMLGGDFAHGRDQRRAQADGAGPRGGEAGPPGRRDAVARARRRQPVRLRQAGDPVRRQAPAAARARRPGQGPARRDRRAGRRRRGPHPRAVLLPTGRGGGGRGGPRAAAAPHHARPGRRAAARAGRAVRRATRTPASSARSASGRGSTSRATPASWC